MNKRRLTLACGVLLVTWGILLLCSADDVTGMLFVVVGGYFLYVAVRGE